MKHKSNRDNNRGGARAVIAGLFLLLGAAIAETGASAIPAAKGQTALPAAAGAGGASAASGSNAAAGEGGAGAENGLNTGSVPVVWFEDTGLFLYRPKEEKIIQVCALEDSGADRMTLYYGQKDPAAVTTVLPDQSGVYFLRALKMDMIGTVTGDLCYVPITESGAGSLVLLAEHVKDYKILPDGGVLWLNANDSLYFISGKPGEDQKAESDQKAEGETKPEARKLGAGVTQFHTAKEGDGIFFVNDLGSGYTADSTGEKVKIAEGIAEVPFVSEDLQKIYYQNAQKDLFFIGDLGLPKIVDVDVQQVAVVKSTGNAYYLKTDRADGAKSETEAAEGSAAETEAVLPDADKTDLTPEEERLVEERLQELIQGLTEDGTITGLDGLLTEETGEAGDESAAAEQILSVGYFDGSSHGVLLRNATGLDDSRLDDMEQDRVLVFTGPEDDYNIWLMRDEKPLLTGITLMDEAMLDMCPDAISDVLYVTRALDGASGEEDEGGVYALSYTEAGFTAPKPVFSGAVMISAARNGRVYAATRPDWNSAATLSVDGTRVSERVTSFFFDENGVRENIQLMRNVFRDTYYVSGEFAEWSPEDGVRPIAYNVREYHCFEDGSFTFLCDYDEDEKKGTLFYWNGTGDPVELSRNAAGTKAGIGE